MTEKLKDEYIREAAYYIWEKEGRPESDGYEFWMKAIKQLSESKNKCESKCACKVASKKESTSGSIIKKVAVKIASKKK